MINYLISLIMILVSGYSYSQEKIYFESSNPFSFKDIIKNTNLQLNQNVYGILRTPKDFNNSDKYPVIIAVAGSNGWSDHHFEYLELYRDNGIVTFELYSFISRGIESTVGTQVEVTTAMMILDAYKALDTLIQLPYVDSEKIGITGWSLGGGVALFSAWEPLRKSINSRVDFSAHLAIYPPCIVVPTVLDFGNKPIQILIGDLDNWTPSEACSELVNKIPNNSNISLTIFQNAHHSFDRDGELKINKNGYILEDCRFVLNEEGEVLMNILNIPMTTPFLQKIGIGMCAKRGPTYGGNKEAKIQSMQISKDFMIKNLTAVD